jgi:AcrR family transcriptional regulator
VSRRPALAASEHAPHARAASDGRVRRGERSRDAIVQALYELIGAGALAPTAQQVAERAGVGLRSVFRHFRDMESLFAEVDAKLLREVQPFAFEPPAQGSLAERVAALAARRAQLFERIAPYKRSGNAQRPASPFLRARHAELVRRLRAALRGWLPELANAPLELAAAIELVSSFEAWDRLRVDQRLSRERAEATLARAVLTLIAPLARQRSDTPKRKAHV